MTLEIDKKAPSMCVSLYMEPKIPLKDMFAKTVNYIPAVTVPQECGFTHNSGIDGLTNKVEDLIIILLKKAYIRKG